MLTEFVPFWTNTGVTVWERDYIFALAGNHKYNMSDGELGLSVRKSNIYGKRFWLFRKKEIFFYNNYLHTMIETLFIL